MTQPQKAPETSFEAAYGLWRLSSSRRDSRRAGSRSPARMTRCCSSSAASGFGIVDAPGDSRDRRGGARAVAGDAVQPAFKMLSRVARIFEQLNNACRTFWRTMTPSEYTHFRGERGQSSGLQSWQYRQIEFMVGNRNRAMLRPHVHRPDILALLEGELLRPSLYDEALRFLSRNGVAVPRASLERDSIERVRNVGRGRRFAWRIVYEAPGNPLASLRTR